MELPIQHGLDVSKPVKTKLPEPLPFPEHLFPLPTLHGFIGERGKGKTYNCAAYLRELFQLGYASTLYAIAPTWKSNPILHDLPHSKKNIKDGVDATENTFEVLQEIIEDIEEAALFHRAQEEYKKTYEKCMKMKESKRSYRNIPVHTRKFMEAMQEKISYQYHQYAELLEELEDTKQQIPPFMNQCLTGFTFPEDNDLDAHGAQGDWPVFFPPYHIPKPHPVLLLDDMSHTKLYSPSRKNPLINLSLRHRHLGGPQYGVSIFFLCQTLKNGMPTSLRQNCRQFSVFRGSDQGVLEDMYKEFGGICTKQEFFDIYNQAIGQNPESHAFLTIDKEAKEAYKSFRRNFDTYLITPTHMQLYHLQSSSFPPSTSSQEEPRKRKEETIELEKEEVGQKQKRKKLN